MYVCTDSAETKTAKVMFDYEATQIDELTIKVDDIVEVIGDEEPGWYVRLYAITYAHTPYTHTHAHTRIHMHIYTHSCIYTHMVLIRIFKRLKFQKFNAFAST